MPLVNAKELLFEATAGKYAVGAFNCTSLIQIEAIIKTAEKKNSPVIIQTSMSSARFLGPKVLSAACRTLAEEASIPVVLHLDHSTDPQFCKACSDAGYSSIMIDGSHEDWNGNINLTRKVVQYCHSRGGISVEGELGTVAGVEDNIDVNSNAAYLADPLQAAEFVELTGVDLFAPSIGTAHGVYTEADPVIDIERFAQIARNINGTAIKTPLVIHGGTGLPAKTVRSLIAAGAAKVNVSTELKHSLIDASWQYLKQQKSEYNPGKLDAMVYDAVCTTVANWIDLLGSSRKRTKAA